MMIKIFKENGIKIFSLIIILFFLSSCKKETSYNHEKEGYTAIAKFELLGGKYANLDTYIKFAYKPFSKITDPSILTNNAILKTGYNIEGWYLEYDETKGIFSDKWNFEEDIIFDKSVTLYPNWIKNINYTYSIVTIENQKEVLIHTYKVNENDLYKDFLNKAKNRKDYTLLGLYSDSAYLNEWDSNFTHPGGETDKDIKVFAKYIEGNFKIVKTKSELTIALNGNYNVYLLNDIDFEGTDFFVSKLYTGTIEGNNHTIKNFKVKHLNDRGTVYTGIFEELENASIKNIRFKDVEIFIKTESSGTQNLYVGLLSGKANHSVFENVSFEGKLRIDEIQKAQSIEFNAIDLIYEGKNNNFVNNLVICVVEDPRN